MSWKKFDWRKFAWLSLKVTLFYCILQFVIDTFLLHAQVDVGRYVIVSVVLILANLYNVKTGGFKL